MVMVKSNGIEIVFQEYGEPAGEPLILVPGLGMSSGLWPQSFVQTLVRGGYRVIAIDNRDSGRSTHLEDSVRPMEVVAAIGRALVRLPVQAPYGLESLAEDALGVADALEMRRFHVAGISMGGMIAQVMAGMAPGRISTLTSISSATGNPRTGFGKVSTIWAILNPRAGGDPMEALDRALKAIGSPAFPRSCEEKRRILQILSENGRDTMAVHRQLLALLKSGDRRSSVALIQAPALIIHGTRDPLLPPAAGCECARLIAGARLELIKDMGHDFPESLGEKIGRIMLSHMARFQA